MTVRFTLSLFVLAMASPPAFADSAHDEPPARAFQPELIAPVVRESADAPHICGMSMLEVEILAEKLRTQAQSTNSVGTVPVSSLPPIQTTPIQ